MLKQSNVVKVWVSHLSLASLLPLLWISLKHGRFYLNYTEATGCGSILAFILTAAKLLHARAEHVLNLNEGERIDTPDSGSFRIQAGIEHFAETFFREYGSILEKTPYADSDVASHRIVLNLRKALVLTTYRLLAFVEFLRYKESGEHRSCLLVVVSPHAVLANTLPGGWAGKDIEFMGQWRFRQSLLFWCAKAILECIRMFLHPPTSKASGSSTVAVEFAQGIDPQARMNDLFWWWNSCIPKERLILYFNRHDCPATHAVVTKAKELGLTCVVLDRKAAGDFPELLWKPAPGRDVAIKRLFQRIRVLRMGIGSGPVTSWIARQFLQLLHRAQSFEDFLKAFNVGAVFNYQDVEVDYISVACDAAGSARIGYHWSHLPWPMPDQLRLHHVYFVWGSEGAAVHNALGSSVDHMLIAGCVIKGAFPGAKKVQAVIEARDAMVARGATRLLALFDNSLPCEAFYEFFLRKIVADARWGLLIKPKGRRFMPTGNRHTAKSLEVMHEQALATGRVRVLDPGISPAEASMCADFAIGIAGVGISTAAIISALAGSRVIQIHCTGLHDSQWAKWAKLYEHGPDRLVFTDQERLWTALNQFWDDPDLDPNLGLVDETLLKAVDPFRDGQTGKRIGQYVLWYLEGLDSGLDRDGALQQATQRYGTYWGEWSVSTGLPPTETVHSSDKWHDQPVA